MPRLLQNSRRAKPPLGRASRGEASADHAPTELPPYEAPSFPMNEGGKRALVEISSNRDTRKYEQHLAKSSAFLRESVGAINDRLHFRITHAEQLAAKRTERGKEAMSEFEAAAAEYAVKIDEEVSALTSRSEAALREVIDYRAELEDEKTVLEQVHDQVHAQKPRQPRPEKKRKVQRRDPGSDDDDEADDDDAETKGEDEDAEMEEPEDDTPYTGASELLDSIRRAKTSEYGYLSMHERYGLNNDYIAFKRTLHDAQYQDGGAPLPDASTWFGPDGRPVVSTIKNRNNAEQNESQEEDDDLVIEREVLSFKCPLTQQTMKEPYSSRVCKHAFEKDAILMFIRENNGECRCPECPAVLRVTDVYFDDIMLRRIQRAENAARKNVDDTSDVEPDADADADQSVSFERSKQVKREGARSRRVAEDLDDDGI